MKPLRVFIGWDASEMIAWNVARVSAIRASTIPLDIASIALGNVRVRGLYTRPTQPREHGYYDEISEAPMATGHAIARFLVPHLCDAGEAWALFMDGDVLVRSDLAELVALADPRYAVQVVQHTHAPTAPTKMEGHTQTRYPRKNWSSVVLWHCAHPANRALTVEMINTRPGRDLHRFCWLEDGLIGALPVRWNVLIDEYTPAAADVAIAHYTHGVPNMPGYEHQAFAEEWYRCARAAGYRLTPPEPVSA